MKEYQNLIEKLSHHLFETHQVRFSLTATGNLKLDGGRANIAPLYESDLKVIQKLDVLDDFFNINKKTLEASLQIHLAKTLKKESTRLAREETNERFKDVTRINLDDVGVMLDIEGLKSRDHANKFLINKKTDKIIQSISIVGVESLIGVEVFKDLTTVLEPSVKRYNPYLINTDLNDRRWTEEMEDIDAQVTAFNLCDHPDWRYHRDLTLQLTDEDKRFIESSFRTKEDLQYFINAAYATIITKMETTILLFGIKGTGKTTLIEMLKNCVGDSNYRKAPQNAFKSNFNAYKRNKRLILHDEATVNNDEVINIIKSDTNKQFNVEEKNKESIAVKNYVSLWFASNNIRDWSFSYDERRFSTLELVADTTLERGISDEFMSDFSERITEEDFSQRLFNYLEKNRTHNFNTMAAHKSPLFYKIVLASLTVWQTAIIDTITGEEKLASLSMSLILDEKDKYAPRKHFTIEDFVDNYRHYDAETKQTYSLGRYVRGRTIATSYILPSERYIAPIKDNSDLEN